MPFWLGAFLAAVGRLRAKKTVYRVPCRRLTLHLPLGVESLEWRVAPSVGGGFTGGGIVGQYYNNTTLTGAPSFTRSDVRVDFNWGTTLSPGGSIAAGYSALGITNYSILWTGQVVPRYSETYTFYVTADDGARLYIRPTGTTAWTTLVDDWTNRVPGTDSGVFTLTAGQAYDIKLEHYQAGDAGEMSLQWASPGTPREVIEPVDQQGWNILPDEFPLYANRMWNAHADWDSGTSDAQGNPTSDATKLVWEGVSNNQGTYQVIFNGQAQLSDAFAYATFPESYVQNGYTFTGVYNASTNTTTATMIITDTGPENFYLNFINTRRTPTSPINTGVTNIKVMAPTTTGSSTPYSPNTYFTTGWESEAALYTVLRAYPAAGTVYNTSEVNWADRVQPTDIVQRQYGFYGGLAWEYFVQLANETGKDLWINLPEDATGTSPTDTTSYVYQLAKLIANGGTDSNGVYHPGLNPNLKLYIEYTNEVWNYGFSAFQSVVALAKAAGPSSPINFDGQAFDSSGNPTNTGIFREQGERTVEISNIFRSVFGDAQMITRVRPVLEWQLGYNSPNGQVALQYIDQYYNNDDGLTHVATPHPVSYFIYGGGGSDYFNASNDAGYTTLVPNAGFETPSVSGSQQAPAGASWTFTGTAGIAANGSSLNNPTAIEGKQVAYLEGINGTNGTISQTVQFPASQTSNVYALSFLAVQRTKKGANTADTQSIDVYVDTTLIGSYTPDAYDPNNPWPEFDTATFTVATPGSSHTIRLVGTSTSGDQMAFLDQVQVTSVDAIFNSGIPDPTYVPALQADAELAGAFGLKYVSYEGGFAVGGDDKVPLATAAYDDPRAQQALVTANTDYQQVGGALFFNGTYAMQGNNPGTLNTPLLNGVKQLDATLPAAATLFGITGPATLPVAASVYADNADPGSGSMNKGGWFRWDVYLPAGGPYNLSSDAGAGGTVQLLVDDVSLGSLNSANSLTAAPLNVTLTSGLHVIEVRAVSGAFTLTNVFLNAGPAPTTGPALDVFNFTGDTGGEVTVNPTTSAAGLTAGPISRGSGLQPDTGNPLDANSFASVSTTTVYGQTFAAAIANNQYYQFTLAPQAGVTLALSSLMFEPEFQNAYAGNGAGITYSVDGVHFTQLTASGTPGSDNPFTVNLSSAAALQGATSTVTIRIYLWGNHPYETTALGGDGNAIIVYGATATNKLAFGQQPTTTAAGGAIAPAVTVLIEDQLGNLITTDSTDTVTLGIASGPGTFTSSSTTTVTASNGVATFANLHLNTAGTYTLSETASSSLRGPASSSFTVTAGAVDHLAVAAMPTSITAGTGVGLVVTALDAFGNPTSDTGTVTFTSNDPQAPTPAAPVTFTGGSAFAVGTLKTATGSGWTLTATDSTAHSGPSNLVTVTPAAATHFSVSAAAVTHAVAIVGGTGGASESGSTVTITTTTAHGFSTGQSVNLAGFSGAASGYNGTVLITAVPTATSFTYTALANRLGLAASGGGTVASVATTGSAFSVVVTALDPYGNTATAYNGTVNLTSSDLAANFPVNHYAFTTTGATPDNGVHTFSATLNTPGTSQTITATDNSNASIVGSTNGGIFTVGLYVTAFATTLSGFTATFNKLLNLSQLDYYRFSGQPVPPDISMNVGSSTTTVNGSVVVSATATQTTLTFVNTGGALTLDQAYMVTLGSGSDGILDTAGGQLAGDANGVLPGTSYSVSVTPVTATAPTLVIAGFARGPGSNVLLPNNTGTGIPVTLKNAPANTKTVTFTLDFNPALLNVTGPTSGNLVLLNPATANSTGVANFSFSSATNLSTSSALLGNVTATVPSSASSQYKAKALLHLPASLITISGAASPTFQSADGVDINAYLGDVNADFKIDGSDAGLVSAVLNAPNNAANQPAGFGAYPLADPALLGSPSSNPATATPKITGTDVTLINRFAANLAPAQIPAPPTGLMYTSAGPDPALSLPAGLQVSAAGTVTEPVNLDDARPVGSTGLTEATLALVYDPRIFTVSASDIHLGTLPASGRGWTLTAVVNAVTGQLAITLESATPIAQAVSGSLVTINFHVQPGVTPGATSVAVVETVDPTGHGLLQTNVFDSQGAFTLNPAPTNGPADPLTALVVLTAAAPMPTTAGVRAAETAAVEGARTAALLPAGNVEVLAAALPSVTIAPAAPLPGSDDEETTDAAASTVSAIRPATHAAGGEAVVASSGVLSAAQQAAALVFQFGNTPALSVPQAAVPHLADAWFPALGRGAADVAERALLVCTLEETSGWVVPGVRGSVPSASDDLDGRIWNGPDTDLDGLSAASATPVAWRSLSANRASEVTAAAVVPERAALDQYFAGMADDPMDRLPDEE